MRCDPIQKKGMPSFSVLALFGVSPNVDSTCPLISIVFVIGDSCWWDRYFLPLRAKEGFSAEILK